MGQAQTSGPGQVSRGALGEALPTKGGHKMSPGCGPNVLSLPTYPNTLRLLREAVQIESEGRDHRCERFRVQEAFRLHRTGKMLVPILETRPRGTSRSAAGQVFSPFGLNASTGRLVETKSHS